mgnify:CR=1 FL=1
MGVIGRRIYLPHVETVDCGLRRLSRKFMTPWEQRIPCICEQVAWKGVISMTMDVTHFGACASVSERLMPQSGLVTIVLAVDSIRILKACWARSKPFSRYGASNLVLR